MWASIPGLHEFRKAAGSAAWHEKLRWKVGQRNAEDKAVWWSASVYRKWSEEVGSKKDVRGGGCNTAGSNFQSSESNPKEIPPQDDRWTALTYLKMSGGGLVGYLSKIKIILLNSFDKFYDFTHWKYNCGINIMLQKILMSGYKVKS